MEESGRGVFDVISWYLDGRAEENQKQMVDTLAGIEAQISIGRLPNTYQWALPLLQRSWLQRTTVENSHSQLIGPPAISQNWKKHAFLVKQQLQRYLLLSATAHAMDHLYRFHMDAWIKYGYNLVRMI